MTAFCSPLLQQMAGFTVCHSGQVPRHGLESTLAPYEGRDGSIASRGSFLSHLHFERSLLSRFLD
jgi:hypothetical protein